ncbi:pyruvate/2-oxoglutarate dehydrogenase complex dihydrolipoamide dehydrogenase (E3) component [Pedobacter sp. UYEF25]
MQKRYDAIIIGSGQAGNPLAKKLAAAGKKTAVIERDKVGGTCINVGCTPTKAMVASAKVAYQTRNAQAMGVLTGDVSVDMKIVKQRTNDIVSLFRDGAQKGLEKTKNLDLIFGEASFVGKRQVQVERRDGKRLTLKSDLIFIDTGAETIIPPISGLNEVGYLTSSSILDLQEVPKHLLIIGGNYIGLEFGQMFRRFGSEVTIVERSERLLKGEENEISAAVTEILGDEGIAILTSTQVNKLSRKGKKSISITLKSGESLKQVECTHVLVAVGRKSSAQSLDLKKAGVKVDEKGFIKINNKLETNVKGIYALGDVKGGPAFTHISYNDYTVVSRNILEGKTLSIKNRQIPYCMFTDPQLGRIGLTSEQAKEQKIKHKVVSLTMDKVGRAIETNESKGLIMAVVDVYSKKILGASVLAAQGGEIMSVLQMAMAGGLTYEQLRYFIFAHPTYAEALNNLFVQLD